MFLKDVHGRMVSECTMTERPAAAAGGMIMILEAVMPSTASTV